MLMRKETEKMGWIGNKAVSATENVRIIVGVDNNLLLYAFHETPLFHKVHLYARANIHCLILTMLTVRQWPTFYSDHSPGPLQPATPDWSPLFLGGHGFMGILNSRH